MKMIFIFLAFILSWYLPPQDQHLYMDGTNNTDGPEKDLAWDHSFCNYPSFFIPEFLCTTENGIKINEWISDHPVYFYGGIALFSSVSLWVIAFCINKKLKRRSEY
ncbi:hypothetical protein EHP00_782 [Ecytonucleospora hepatopenaei]|uniref:Uncharacterized protein n=1 Tax=Ecytonucleospora hepatopenaei TaxID=646526 RepID=A0A1W0E7U3_9MICR|nr:hypothetical protein EHP00_782 [Ecytonucleospora hepatopenaei]